MDFLLDALTQWLKEMLVGGIMGNLSGMFDSVNQQVADIATQVGQTPQGWNGSIFSMIQNLSNSIMVPIAGVILAIVMTLELIQMITDRNNLHDVDTWMIFKWVFKSAAAILIVTNTWNIVMGVFDMAQSVVAQAAGIIGSDASIDISSVMGDMETRLMEMDLGPLIGLWAQSLVIGITMWALYICIFIVIYGRMIEIYLVTSVAPIPMATMMSKESGGMGQNYLRSLLALGFQAFLIIVCVAIYAVLVQNIATESDIIMAIWSCVGYTVLLCFTLFKTGSLANARWAKVFNLKQMAQTMNFLTEHNLLEYAVLEEKAAAATAHHNELSAQIKAAEKRMAEIAVLRTHIINYAKTREIYVAYRQAGYSKKFRQEHEAEILLHQTAKNAFDDMGVKKLPKVKELQTEYAKLLEEKKKIYAEYRRSREEMRELLTAKANVDRLLKMNEEQKQEKEKDHDQR